MENILCMIASSFCKFSLYFRCSSGYCSSNPLNLRECHEALYIKEWARLFWTLFYHYFMLGPRKFYFTDTSTIFSMPHLYSHFFILHDWTATDILTCRHLTQNLKGCSEDLLGYHWSRGTGPGHRVAKSLPLAILKIWDILYYAQHCTSIFIQSPTIN